MKIGVDARELAGHPTGVGRYLGELLACWSRDPAAAAHDITLFTPGPLSLPAGLIGAGGARVVVHVVGGDAGVWWEQTRLGFAARAQVDVLFGPGYSVPVLPGIPTVVAMHDVSFCAHPEWFGPREGWRRRLVARAAARRARRVLTISNFSRDEIVRLLGISADKIRVTPLATGGFFNPAAHRPVATSAPALASEATASALAPSGQGRPDAVVAREPLVLYVGSIFNRRHVPTLLRAFAPVGRSVPDARLVIVGDNRTRPHEDLDTLARELGVAPQVRIAAYVSDHELADLYRRARAFAFLSTYEGFALTPLEALAAGVPSILFDTPVAREVFRDAALFVPPGDELGVTAALRALMDHPAVHAHYLTAGAALLKDYSWSRTASATLAVLLEAAGDARPRP
jgi:alpha-1,3-rhamnosyl/mannosyltransferase